ncbi:MAG: glycoside hydrolase family 25 protein [Ruminococcus sp.]|nr:glycoside hydrolase family 25 protein [Ruminococcus sp.]
MKKFNLLALTLILSFTTINASAVVSNQELFDTYNTSKQNLIIGESDDGQSSILEVLYNKNQIIKSSKQDFLYKPDGVLYKGIDVSSYQGEIDWQLVKEQGVEFAILRAGYVSSIDGNYHVDTYFERNYQQCKELGIPVGCYWFTRARTTTQAENEAQFFVSIIDGKQFEYPVCFDIESESLTDLSSTTLTNITIAFCSKMESNGYYTSIYCNPNWIDYILIKDNLTDYDKWLAHWTTTPKYDNSFGGLWQYGLGSCIGIQGDCDLDYSYRDYPTIIKNAGLNGF